ncbi:Os03g0268501 [Oryza sativa Japonica Group]|uniref:Os03g0268501 protein n=1 Tax=Oryza sativa subsp. japonica TaxID=39947 RepID=A0A0P0VW63_ORYSJ|nr:Os03g0268501 [Oryza sativa Japonica Group]
MEGLLPFVYRAIVHKRDGHRAIGNPFLNDDPAAAATAYKRLATCDSGTYSRPATTVDAPFLGGAVVTVHKKMQNSDVSVTFLIIAQAALSAAPRAESGRWTVHFQQKWADAQMYNKQETVSSSEIFGPDVGLATPYE